MKRLKFSDPLTALILSGKKSVTWRVEDEKKIAEGDELALCKKDGREFGKAVVVKIKETTFGKLDAKDRNGHEQFSSEKEMYETYSRYYGKDVGPETGVEVIRFKLIGN